ncbi:hypothetical protein L2E82_00329 [Cichorium intybus]|uniref:Uncharacterized protein n=1 Tax=Cichorium intybus TaxID=13427 RepID=A0ACB9GXA6_CICIN|nr:hypothetical protein L2E82_00329 [Cichorium intybus]
MHTFLLALPRHPPNNAFQTFSFSQEAEDIHIYTSLYAYCSAVLAYIILKERLHIFGVVGCALCVVGSTTIVLHAPEERAIESVTEVWYLATEPVCSLLGSLSVMSVKGLGIALKLTFSGTNQLVYPQTRAFTFFVLLCVITQMNYLNKALDTFNTAVMSPIYYVMLTSLTILASVIMFKDWDGQNPTHIVTELCGIHASIFNDQKNRQSPKAAIDLQNYSLRRRDNPEYKIAIGTDDV